MPPSETFFRLRCFTQVSFKGNFNAMKSVSAKKLAAAALVCTAAFASWKMFFSQPAEVSRYRTAVVAPRDIKFVIDVSGTVEPEDLVDVGARVSGEILSFGKDADGKTVDYASRVREGERLALIDDEIQRSELLQAQAQLEVAKAAEAQARANLALDRAVFTQAMRDWERAEKLGVGDALSQSEYDSYLASYEKAAAQIDVDNAKISAALAEIAQAEANVKTAERNLSYCEIKAPVDGIVIDRKVNIGQTVVSNMSVSSLFSIAKDLRRMEVWASVNEADIGYVKPGQKVEFTVDAFPGEKFSGYVGKIRLNATMSQNVVTYTVEVVVDNSDGRLLPYLTANLKFEVESEAGVLSVPNSALNFEPDFAEPAADGAKRVWVLRPGGADPVPVEVEAGLTDGVFTKVSSPELSGGEAVVTGIETVSSASASASNPFMPKPPRRRQAQQKK